MCCRCWVPNPQSPVLTRLDLPGAPSRWEELGFSISSDGVEIGQVGCRLGATEAGWGFDSGEVTIPGIPAIATTDGAPAPTSRPAGIHANGAFKIDHVVVASDDPQTTKSQLESFGFVGKGERLFGDAEAQRSQTFFWSGDLLLELVGPARQSIGGASCAQIWGVTFVTPDFVGLERTAGALLGPARPAVQPGRQICIVGAGAGIGLQIAFLTPHLNRPEPKN